jgi:hypothetical protein
VNYDLYYWRHSRRYFLFQKPKAEKAGEKDILIVWAISAFSGTRNNEKEHKNFDALRKKKYTICFVDGAHENFDNLNSYGPLRWKGGTRQNCGIILPS